MRLVAWMFGLIFCGVSLLSAECTTVYLVRHGQTDWNLQGRMQSIENNSLNEVGRNQAQELSSKFKDVSFEAVFSSGLKRVNETALIIAKPVEIKIISVLQNAITPHGKVN